METPISVAHNLHHANRRKSNDRKTFSLETYLNFLLTRGSRNLSVDHMNKIISIHGFKKATVRKIAEETLSLITDPILPTRSTLKDNIPSSTSNKPTITLKEVLKDLKLLNWQECSVTSIKTISSKNYYNPADIPTANPDDVPLTEVAAKLMSLRGNKRHWSPSPTPLDNDATSVMSSGSGPGENGSGFGGCESSSKAFGCDSCVSPSKVPGGCVSSSKLLGCLALPSSVCEIGVKKRETGQKRVYLKNLYNNDDTQTAMAGSSSLSTKRRNF